MCRTSLFMTVDEHFVACSKCKEIVKLFRFLLSPYNLIGTWKHMQNCAFVSVEIYFIAYCRCRDAVKLFRFLLSPYSLIQHSINRQSGIFH
jgi:hypothetical protein